jgi:ATP-binding cassette, subfamily C (CFTR/MRP), member 1
LKASTTLVSFISQILVGTKASQYVSKNLRPRQKAWNLKTQERISALTSMLSSMKAIKSLGLSEVVAEHIQQLRLTEIQNANKVRWVMVIYNASGE